VNRDSRIDLAEELFGAWSSGSADAPAEFFHSDGVLYDIIGGRYEGWPAIRAYFANGLVKWPDLVLKPDGFWTNDKGVALRWVMTATITSPATFGEQFVGRVWKSEGMTLLDIEDGLVRLEVDYHDRAAAPRSLGIEVLR
jgi:SnoaL-like domain